MSEDLSKNNIEAEIAELSQKIAEKRKMLEASSNIVAERDLLKASLTEQIANTVPQVAQSTKSTVATSVQQATRAIVKGANGKSYLDFLDPESQEIVERLVEDVFIKGMEKTFKELEFQEPYIIDAFHDMLTDKLYAELKRRGIFK